MSKWRKLRDGHWVSAKGWEALRENKRCWCLYDQDGVKVHEHDRDAWTSLKNAQDAASRVESEGEAIAARHVKLL